MATVTNFGSYMLRGALGRFTTLSPHLSNGSNPVILLLLRVCIHEESSLRSANLQRVPLLRLELGALDRRARRQVYHAVGHPGLRLCKEELGTLEDEVATAPVLEPRGLFGQPTFELGITAVVTYTGGGISVGRTGGRHHEGRKGVVW